MGRPLLFALISSLAPFHGSAQTPDIEWQRCLGGIHMDQATNVIQTSDGGYAVTTFSISMVGVDCGGEGDGWLVKLNAMGEEEWTYCSDFEWADDFTSVAECADGGFIVVGSRGLTFGGMIVIKLSSAGIFQWQHLFPNDPGIMSGREIWQLNDGGFIVLGESYTDGPDIIPGHHGYSDAWLVRLDAFGEVIWDRLIGTSGFDVPTDLILAPDGGYLIAGTMYGTDTLNCGGLDYTDGWIARVDALGEVLWMRCLGIMAPPYGIATADGGWMLATSAGISPCVPPTNGGTLLKLNSNGVQQWEVHYGAPYPGASMFTAVQQMADGSYVAAGRTEGGGCQVTGFHGVVDAWIIRVSPNGVLLGELAVGGSDSDLAKSMILTSDGGYLTVGDAESEDGDVIGVHGDYDAWVVKFEPEAVGIDERWSPQFSISPNPSSGIVQLSIPSGSVKGTIAVVNGIGQTVHQQPLERTTEDVDLRHLPKGPYAIMLRTERGARSELFLLQ